MKYKKYLLILLIAVFLGCNKTYAASNNKICTYASNNFQGSVELVEKNNGDINIKNFNVGYLKGKMITGNPAVANEKQSYSFGSDFWQSRGEYGYKVPKITINKDSNGEMICPKYALVAKIKTLSNTYYKLEVVLVDDANTANAAVSKLTNLSKEAYFAPYSDIFLQQQGIECNGEDCIVCEPGTPSDECNVEITCGNIDTIFGDKNTEGTIANLINQVMTYIRIIVPIIIILLGSLDLAKAVIASKDDEIKKAQSTFLKRVIAGVAVFFVPVFVNIVIELSNIVWQGEELETCNIEVLE